MEKFAKMLGQVDSSCQGIWFLSLGLWDWLFSPRGISALDSSLLHEEFFA